jgi:glycosyltransferase involved in cell wall biosynthesis
MKFSIITPTYNRADLIERAVKSILNQSYQNFEMIIVDDGSTDNTEKIISKYSDDVRIRYVKATQNGGVNKARNIGIKSISEDSDWITFLDSDDEFCPDALENMLIAIKRENGINYFRFPVIYTNGKTVCNLDLINSVANFERYLSIIDNCGEWVVTLKREVINRGFLYEERVNGSESIAYMRLSKTENIFFDKSVARIYHTDNDGITRNNNRGRLFYENQLKAFSIILEDFGGDLFQYNRKVYVSYLYEQSILNIILGNKKIGIIQALNAMKYDLFNLGFLRIVKNLIVKKIN